MAPIGDRRRVRIHCRKTREDRVVVSQGCIERIGKRYRAFFSGGLILIGADVSLVRTGGIEQDKLIGVADRQAAQDNLLKNREDTGVGADAEGEGEDGNGGEGWVLGQHSNAESEIAPQAVQDRSKGTAKVVFTPGGAEPRPYKKNPFL